MNKNKNFSTGKILLFSGIIILSISNIALIREVIKLKKVISIQSSIEARRTSLMVIYQKVLTNISKELETLKISVKRLERKNSKIF